MFREFPVFYESSCFFTKFTGHKIFKIHFINSQISSIPCIHLWNHALKLFSVTLASTTVHAMNVKLVVKWPTTVIYMMQFVMKHKTLQMILNYFVKFAFKVHWLQLLMYWTRRSVNNAHSNLRSHLRDVVSSPDLAFFSTTASYGDEYSGYTLPFCQFIMELRHSLHRKQPKHAFGRNCGKGVLQPYDLRVNSYANVTWLLGIYFILPTIPLADRGRRWRVCVRNNGLLDVYVQRTAPTASPGLHFCYEVSSS